MVTSLVGLILLLGAVYGSDYRCVSQSGTCQDDTLSCTGVYQSGLCDGNVGRRCCIPGGSDSACSSLSGTCQEDNLPCPGGYRSGLCSGDANRRCCLSSTGSANSNSGSCSNVNIISRSQWGARAPKSTTTEHVPVHEFFVHHTEGRTCYSVSECSSVLRGIQNYHMNDRNWSDIGYSFLVGEDGNVYEGRGWTHVGAHTAGYNSKSFAASVMGSYTSHKPGQKALQAVKDLLQCGIQLGKIAPDYRLYGHRDAGSTSCPGDALYAEIQTWPHYSHVHP